MEPLDQDIMKSVVRTCQGLPDMLLVYSADKRSMAFYVHFDVRTQWRNASVGAAARYNGSPETWNAVRDLLNASTLTTIFDSVIT